MLVGGYLYAENKAEGRLDSNFFYLREGHLCWKKASDAKADLGSIDLNQCEDEEAIVVGEATPRRKEGKQLFRFEVATGGSGVKLFARSDEERNDWVTSLKISVLGAKLRSGTVKELGDAILSKASDAIFQLQDVILQMQLGYDDFEGPELGDAEVGPLVKEKLAEALMKSRQEMTSTEMEQRLVQQAEEHEAELAEARVSAVDLRRKVEVLERQLEESPFTTPASTARMPSQEAFEEVTRRAEWLEKRLKEAEDREDQLLEQQEASDRAQAVLEGQMAALSGQFQHGGAPVRLDRQVERAQEELKERDEELLRVKRQLKVEREEAEAAQRQQRYVREEREEEMRALREAAKAHEAMSLEKTESIASLRTELAELKRQLRGSKESEREQEGSAAKEIALVVNDVKARHQAEVREMEEQAERLRARVRGGEQERKALADRVAELVRASEEQERVHKREVAAVEEDQKVQAEVQKLKYEEQLIGMEQLAALARTEESTQLRVVRTELAEATTRLRETTRGLEEAEGRAASLGTAKAKVEKEFDRLTEEALESAAVIRRLEKVIQVSREEQDGKGREIVEKVRDVHQRTQEEAGQRLQYVEILQATTEQLTADRNSVVEQLEAARYTLDAVSSAIHCPNDSNLPRRAAEMWQASEELKDALESNRRALDTERARMEREVKATLDSMAKDSQEARRSLQETDAGLASIRAQLERAEDERDAARHQLSLLRNEMESNVASENVYKEKSSKLLKQITGEAARVEELENEKSALRLELGKAEVLVRQGEKDVAAMIEQHLKFETQIAELHQLNHDQEVKVVDSLELTNKLRHAREEQRKAMARREREFGEELAKQADEHANDWKKAQEEIMATIESRDSALKEIARLQEHCKRQASSMEDLDLKIKVLDHECTTLKWKHDNAEATAQRARDEAEKLRASLNRQSQHVAQLDSAVQNERIHSMKEEVLKTEMETQAEIAQTEAAAAIQRERRRTKELMSVVSTVWDYRGKELQDVRQSQAVSKPRSGDRTRATSSRVSWTHKANGTGSEPNLKVNSRPESNDTGPGLYPRSSGSGADVKRSKVAEPPASSSSFMLGLSRSLGLGVKQAS